ncbi:MAG: hypothetical protein LBE13_04435 [Bacteroidales bacterium]|nr:hypothetical protein [Bacteroidales bacterium]
MFDKEHGRILKSGVIKVIGSTLREKIIYLEKEIIRIGTDTYGIVNTVYVERLLPSMSKQTSFAFGALMGMIWSLDNEVQEVKPIEWRKLVYRNLREWDIKGIGREKQKALAISEVKRRFNYKPIDDNEAEAILIAFAGSILG